jgi:hypothetical protein
MPKVGTRKFSYTKAGKKAAKAFAKRTGKKVVNPKGYKKPTKKKGKGVKRGY